MKTLKFIGILLAFACVSCQSTKTAIYDQYSYQQTIAIKIEASNIMDKATTSYASHQVVIEKLFLEIDQLVEYEKNKPDNEITFDMWQVLTDKEKNLLGGFFKRWKEKESLSPVFLKESKKQITDAFDLLIQYEIKKDKESKEGLLNLISK
jgi:hypothetical protein